MIIDGHALAQSIVSQTRELLQDTTCVMHTICVAPNQATRSYLRIKEQAASAANIRVVLSELPGTATTNDVIARINEVPTDAVLVQLPVPAHIDEEAVRDAIPFLEDADVLSSAAYAAFLAQREGARVPPVAAAVAEMLTSYQIETAGKRAVVVGSGRLVGQPCAALLRMLGAQVSVITLEQGSLSDLRDADIVVSGAGAPHIIRSEHIRDGVVIFDAGTSEQGGVLVGDVHPKAAEKAVWASLVPGGLGPVAVACLMRNVALATIQRF